MTTLEKYLKRSGRTFPAGSVITGEDLENAGLPMIVRCYSCDMSMCIAADLPCTEDGAILCTTCWPKEDASQSS